MPRDMRQIQGADKEAEGGETLWCDDVQILSRQHTHPPWVEGRFGIWLGKSNILRVDGGGGGVVASE
jgi:hypothetical protein